MPLYVAHGTPAFAATAAAPALALLLLLSGRLRTTDPRRGPE
ncbi:hypothetical protein [Actinomadura sp. KC345]|nr:hypothetical protein [Actinomadura sp. KC345]